MLLEVFCKPIGGTNVVINSNADSELRIALFGHRQGVNSARGKVDWNECEIGLPNSCVAKSVKFPASKPTSAISAALIRS
ncbi:MAG: hypothetical protein DMF21_00405 [Verrucomicrobia bacterium]|nr:MAG: hypothetical protein DMF21_00405 [Verrucomicrobiota bacterium]